MKIRLSSPLSFDSIVDGPGLRTVIWTQGCTHNCNECHNPQTHNLRGGYEEDIKKIISTIKEKRLQRGITLSGGEPFLQQGPLEQIAKEAKKSNLDVWAYTGFTFEQLLDKGNPKYSENIRLLNQIDVLVDGKFIYEEYDINLKFRGSANQRIIDVQRSLINDKVFLVDEYMNNQLYAIK